MEKPTSEKKWSELDLDGNRYFHGFLKDHAVKLADLATAASMELTKYLFAANTGAAAGLFILLKSSTGREYLWAFFIFCFGTFFVGVSYFVYASWMREISETYTDNLNRLGRGEFTFGEFDEKNSKRFHSCKAKIARWCVIVSFLLLIAGGIITGVTFWIKPGS
jgi:hypothetical protein